MQTKRKPVKWSIHTDTQAEKETKTEASGQRALILLTARQLITRHNNFNNFRVALTETRVPPGFVLYIFCHYQHFGGLNILINSIRAPSRLLRSLWLLSCCSFRTCRTGPGQLSCPSNRFRLSSQSAKQCFIILTLCLAASFPVFRFLLHATSTCPFPLFSRSAIAISIPFFLAIYDA